MSQNVSASPESQAQLDEETTRCSSAFQFGRGRVQLTLGLLLLWLASGTVMWFWLQPALKIPVKAKHFQFSPDAKVLATFPASKNGGGRRPRFWSTATGEELAKDVSGVIWHEPLEGSYTQFTRRKVAFGKRGGVWTWTEKAGLALIDVETSEVINGPQPLKRLSNTFGPSRGEERRWMFSADDSVLAYMPRGGLLVLWDLTDGVEFSRVPIQGIAALSPDGRRFAWAEYDPKAGKKTVVVWDVVRATRLKNFAVDRGFRADAMAFSPNGSRLAVAGSASRDSRVKFDDSNVYLWDIETDDDATRWRMPWANSGMTLLPTLSFSPSGRFLIGRFARSYYVFGDREGEWKLLYKAGAPAPTFSSDDSLCAMHWLRRYDPEAKKAEVARRKASGRHASPRWYDENIPPFAAPVKKTVVLDVETLSERASFNPPGWQADMRFTPDDGSLLITAARTELDRVWNKTWMELTSYDLASGSQQVIAEWEGGLQFSPDGMMLAMGSDDEIRIQRTDSLPGKSLLFIGALSALVPAFVFLSIVAWRGMTFGRQRKAVKADVCR